MSLNEAFQLFVGTSKPVSTMSSALSSNNVSLADSHGWQGTDFPCRYCGNKRSEHQGLGHGYEPFVGSTPAFTTDRYSLRLPSARDLQDFRRDFPCKMCGRHMGVRHPYMPQRLDMTTRPSTKR